MIFYKIAYSKRKTVAISIDALGEVTVKAPIGYSVTRLERFVSEKSGWLARKKQTIDRTLQNFRPLLSGQAALCFGRLYTIDYRPAKEPFLCGQTYVIPQKYFNQSYSASCVKKWFSTATSSYIESKIHTFSTLMHTDASSIRLMSAKSRWGTCSSARELRFHWKLSMLPPELIDYVIVHELSHTFEMNHSAKFWNIVEGYMPNYRALKKKLQSFSFVTLL